MTLTLQALMSHVRSRTPWRRCLTPWPRCARMASTVSGTRPRVRRYLASTSDNALGHATVTCAWIMYNYIYTKYTFSIIIHMCLLFLLYNVKLLCIWFIYDNYQPFMLKKRSVWRWRYRYNVVNLHVEQYIKFS